MKKIFSLVVILFCGITSFSQTNTWTGFSSSNWNTTTNWSLGVVPTAAHDVVININAAIIVNTVNPTINSLTISGSANVSFTSNGAARTITIDNTGSSIILGSTLTLQGSTGSGTRFMQIAYTGINRTMSIAGTLVLTDVGEGSNYIATNSLTTVTGTIRCQDLTGTAFPPTITSTTTNLSFLAGGTYSHAMDGNSIPIATWNITSLCYITGITGNFPTNFDANTFGNVTWNCASQTVNSPGSFFANGFNILGNLTIQNTNIAGGGMFRFGGITPQVNYIGKDFIITGGEVKISGANGRTVTVTGNFSISNSARVLMDDASTPAIFNLAGNFSHLNNSILYETGPTTLSVINFNGTTTQYFTKSTTSVDSNQVNYAILNGAIVDFGTYVLDGKNSVGNTQGYFNLNSGGTIITAHPAGLNTAGATGTIQLTGTRTFSSGANYTYNGTAIQNSGIFTTTPTANQVNNLTVNNTAGNTTTGVTLQQAFAVANILTLTSGHITTTSTNLLTMNAASNVSGSNYALRIPGSSFDSYVNGPMRKIGNTNFLFPLGKINAGNHFCGISSPLNITDTYTAEYIRGTATLLGGITAVGLDHVSNCEYWTITTTAASPNVNVTLSWNGNSNCNAAVYVNDLATLRAAHFGSSWDSYGGSADPLSTAGSGSLTWNGVTTFSPFSLGSTSNGTNPLPVKLVNVRAYRSGDRNKIEWTNLTETIVINYEVERSGNGIEFTSIGQQLPKSNSNDRQDYFLLDYSPLIETNFYRIRVLEQNGRVTYSKIVKVETGTSINHGFSIYPNPVIDKQVSVNINGWEKGQYTLRVFNSLGLQVFISTINYPGGSMTEIIQLPSSFKQGYYLIQISNGKDHSSRSFIVQ